MFMPCNPMKAKIERWLKTKELEFVQKDNKNPNLTPHKYLDKYVFSDLHEVFFCDFAHLLQEWLLRLKDNHPTNKIRQLEWNPVDIVQLQQVNNKKRGEALA
jgi:DNA-directed RNA polymerase